MLIHHLMVMDVLIHMAHEAEVVVEEGVEEEAVEDEE